MMPGKVARMTAYLGSTFPDQLIQEQKAVQAGARVGFDAAQQSVESHLVLVGNPVPGFNDANTPRPGEISSFFACTMWIVLVNRAVACLME